MFRGSLVALVTPMKNNHIDLERFEALVKLHLDAGTHGLVIAGTTGESGTLSHSEKQQLVKKALQVVDNRIPVIAGISANSTSDAIESAKQMKEAYKVLENGNNVLKKLNEEVNIEKWERIADDLSDLKQQQDEIGNFFKSHGIEQSEFEEEVDKELDDLFKSVSQQEIESLPEAGTKEIQQKKEASDKHAALLEA
jgi:uncharacterized protein Yka (UPF0111/DUF47 family)